MLKLISSISLGLWIAGSGFAADTKTAAPKDAAKAVKTEKAKVDAPVAAATAKSGGPRVELKTSLGKIVIELNADKAPISTANFISYVEKKHYNNTVFHRVINDFMIQGGGFKVAGSSLEETEAGKPIKNESTNGLSNSRGTIAMARTSDPDSATAQFYINVKDNNFLDSQAGRPGYAVFGKVVEGMEVVDKIKAVKTGNKVVKARNDKNLADAPFQDVPVENVVIESATVIKSGT
jgi:cyclophilin family peptidyl-prolyl cis-trans isomerase